MTESGASTALEAVAGLADAAVLRLAPGLRIREASGSFAALVGVPADVLAGRGAPFSWWPALDARLVDALCAGPHRSVVRASGRGMVTVEARAARVDGDVVVALRSVSPAEPDDARYRAVVETAVDAIVMIDEEGVLLAVNEATTRLFGYGRQELLGRNVSILMRDEDARAHDGYLRRRDHGSSSVVGVGREVTGRHRDGTEIPLHLAVGQLEHEGRTCFTGFLRDLRSMHAAQARTAAAEAALAELATGVEAFVYLQELHADGSCTLLHAGPGRERFFPPQTGFFERVHPDERDAVRDSIARAHADPGEAVLRIVYRTVDDRWFADRARITRDGSRVLARGVVVDVSDEWRLADDLAHSEGLQRTLIATLSEGVAILGPDGEVLLANPAARRLLGDAEGRIPPAPWPFLRESGDPLPLDENPTAALEGLTEPRRGLIVGRDAGAHERSWLRIDSEPVDDPSRAGTIVVTVRDITEERLREIERSALHALADAVAAETPLRSIFQIAAEQASRAIGADVVVLRYDLKDRAGAGEVDVIVVGTSRTHRERAMPALGSRVRLPVRTSRDLTSADVELDLPAEIAGTPFVGRSVPIRVAGSLWGALAMVRSPRAASTAEGFAERVGDFASLLELAIGNAEARQQLALLASTDHLTGLYNRRAFAQRLEEEVARARRHGRPLSLVVIDVDHFKLINDTYGHPVGDRVLSELAATVAGTTRASEVVARVGGEEFAWILPDTDGAAAFVAAERLRQRIEHELLPGVGRVTASLGVCDLSQASSPSDLFRLADVALYWAKAQGRNRTFHYSSQTVEHVPADEQERRLSRARSLATIRALASAVDAKDPITRAHSDRVAELAARMAECAGWSEDEVARLAEAALVHDVGKIALPDAVLFKPGPLDPEERQIVQTHATVGATMASDALDPEQVSWLRSHHERLDGSGYPDGLVGDAIPMGARLLAVADAWDAMTVARPYGAPRTESEALLELERVAGSQLDADAVAALRAALGRERRPFYTR